MPTENKPADPFQREDRYIVIKRSDLKKVPVSYRSSLVDPMFSLLCHLPRRECLVIESDWPEYEPYWHMIERRMTWQAEACDHEWTDDGEFLLVCTKCGTHENHDPKWRDMESAPRDGTLIRLLVNFDEHSTEDADEAPTIGANNFDNDGEDAWRFAGWCWTHDHFTQGVGTPVGWLPMIEARPSTAELDRVTAERDALQLRLNAADQQIDELTAIPQNGAESEPPTYKPGLYAVRHIDNWDGERDVALTFAQLDADGKWTDNETGDALLTYRGDKILRAWPLDCSDAPDTQIIGVPRDWLQDWALELVEAAQDGGQMSNQVEHLLEIHSKP
jgi:hypothetical protein